MIRAFPGKQRLIWLTLLMLAGGVSTADDAEPFVVRSAGFNLDQSLLLLDLVVDSEIPDYISIAIRFACSHGWRQ